MDGNAVSLVVNGPWLWSYNITCCMFHVALSRTGSDGEQITFWRDVSQDPWKLGGKLWVVVSELVKGMKQSARKREQVSSQLGVTITTVPLFVTCHSLLRVALQASPVNLLRVRGTQVGCRLLVCRFPALSTCLRAMLPYLVGCLGKLAPPTGRPVERRR
jgi:hypothetical protein